MALQRNVTKFTADDASGELYVLCTESEWDDYLPLITQLDQPGDDGDPFVRLTLNYIDAETAVERLGQMMPTVVAADANVRLIPTDDGLLVVGATPPQIDRIKIFLKEVDRPSTIERRTYIMQHADPAEIKSAPCAISTSSKPKPTSRCSVQASATGSPRQSRPQTRPGSYGTRLTGSCG